jgi:hypothetical protein
MVALDVKGEFFRNSQRTDDVERRTVFGEVSNRTINRAAAELDRGALESPMPNCLSPFQHDYLRNQQVTELMGD